MNKTELPQSDLTPTERAIANARKRRIKADKNAAESALVTMLSLMVTPRAQY